MKNGFVCPHCKAVIDERRTAMLTPKEKAEEVLRENNLSKVPIDVVSLAQRYGFSVELNNQLLSNVKGRMEIDPAKQRKSIEIGPAAKNYEKSREVIAHELGHYFIHYRDSQKAEFRSDDTNDVQERESDEFARTLLMPEVNTKKAFQFYEKNQERRAEMIGAICGLFAVSEDFVKKRMEELKIALV